MKLEMFRHIPAGTGDHSRSTCEICGLHFSGEGCYRIPGLKGLFCSLVCIECGVAEKTGQKKRIAGAPIGSAARLLLYLKTAAPGIYAQLAPREANDAKRYLQCGTPLNGKRSDSRFCGHAHQVRFLRKTSTIEKLENSRHTPIGKQRLTEAQNGGSMNTSIRSTQALETALGMELLAAEPARSQVVRIRAGSDGNSTDASLRRR